jgi:hypothetical protein
MPEIRRRKRTPEEIDERITVLEGRHERRVVA